MNNTTMSFITESIRIDRASRFNESNQLSLGELIEKLSEIPYLKDKAIRFDFAYFAPQDLHSWRGAYEELAVSYGENDDVKASDFLELCKGAVGKTFAGYKGGEFVMTGETPVWVAMNGMSGNTAIVDVSNRDYTVILHTAYMEY